MRAGERQRSQRQQLHQRQPGQRTGRKRHQQQQPPGELNDGQRRNRLPERFADGGHDQHHPQAGGGEEDHRRALVAIHVALQHEEPRCGQNQRERANLEAHAVIRAQRIVRVAVAPEGAEVLAPLHKVVAEVIGIGGIDLLAQQPLLGQQGCEEDGAEQQPARPRCGRQPCTLEQCAPGGTITLAIATPQPSQPEEHKKHQQRRHRQHGETVCQPCRGKQQHRQRKPPLPAGLAALEQQFVKGQKKPRQPEEEQRLVERTAHVYVQQVIGRVDIEQCARRRRQARAIDGRASLCARQRIAPVQQQPVHAHTTEQNSRNPRELDGNGKTRAQQHKEGDGVEAQRRHNDKGGVTVALQVVHGPTWPERAAAQRRVKHHGVEDAVAAVVGVVEVEAGGKQRGQRGQAQQEQQQQVGVERAQSRGKAV